MKILYGVQATGNGHTTRARSMAREFSKTDIQVDYLFSGRPRDAFFDMDVFGDFRSLRGMTFSVKQGRLQYLQTAIKNNLFQLLRDIRCLDVSAYDLVISDFEPVTAWAARQQNKTCVGIAHQYAFQYDIPSAGKTLLGEAVLKHFAPTPIAIGLHWSHFGQPILPPLIEKNPHPVVKKRNCILVYLPFEDCQAVSSWLRQFAEYQFAIYCGIKQIRHEGNVSLKPFCRDGFQRDLATCGGVIANAGFGLCSEALDIGKKLLVKPVAGQIEQLSNAVALEKLGYADVMHSLDAEAVEDWLDKANPAAKNYPNVAQQLVQWIANGMQETPVELARRVWGEAAGEFEQAQSFAEVLSCS